MIIAVDRASCIRLVARRNWRGQLPFVAEQKTEQSWAILYIKQRPLFCYELESKFILLWASLRISFGQLAIQGPIQLSWHAESKIGTVLAVSNATPSQLIAQYGPLFSNPLLVLVSPTTSLSSWVILNEFKAAIPSRPMKFSSYAPVNSECLTVSVGSLQLIKRLLA